MNAQELTAAQLEDEVAKLSAHMNAGMCRWLELVAELDRRGCWIESGSGSCAEWLAWRCAISPRAARDHVRVARRLPELPLIRDAFARGELSYTKVRALTRVATPESQGELLRLGRALTAAQLDRAVAAYRRVTAAEAEDLHSSAYVAYQWDADGSLYVQGRLAPEDGALFLRALEAGRDAVRERKREWDEERARRVERGPAGPHEPRYRPTNADALVAMAGAALTAAGATHSNTERYQVVVHVDADAGATLERGPALARETVDRISCDSSVVRVTERDGKPLSVGRRTRAVTPAIARALRTRDRGCRFPGCENHRFVDAHHIQHWSRGGETTLDNLVLLCRRHHRFVHEGGYSVELIGNEPRFRTRWGWSVADVPRPPPGSRDALVKANALLGIGAETLASGEGEEMDLSITVEAFREAVLCSAPGNVTSARSEETFDDASSRTRLLEPRPMAAVGDRLQGRAWDDGCGGHGAPERQRVEVAVDHERSQTNVRESVLERSRLEVALE